MSVTSIIVTRGDVSLKPIMESIPDEWERLVWINGTGCYRWLEDITGDDETKPSWAPKYIDRKDYSVYGRYVAVQYASHDLIYVQDDDVIVSDPDAIVRAYYEDMLVCNMPQEFRHNFYTDHALVGFGAAFHRDAPNRAFSKFIDHYALPGTDLWAMLSEEFMRTCDVIFTGLTPRILVDVPKENLPYAEDDNRMWKQPTHQGERARMRELMLAVREAE